MVVRKEGNLIQVFNAYFVRPVERSVAKIDFPALPIPLWPLFRGMGPNEDVIGSREPESHHKLRVLIRNQLQDFLLLVLSGKHHTIYRSLLHYLTS